MVHMRRGGRGTAEHMRRGGRGAAEHTCPTRGLVSLITLINSAALAELSSTTHGAARRRQNGWLSYRSLYWWLGAGWLLAAKSYCDGC